MQPSPVYISLKESFIQQIATLDSLYLMNETKNSKSGCSLWPRKSVNEGKKKKKRFELEQISAPENPISINQP